MSGQWPTDPGALVGAALWRIVLLSGAIALLLLLLGPIGLLLVLLGILAWVSWRGGVLPTALPMPGLAGAGVALLAVVLLLSGGGLLLLALVALGLIIAGLIGPTRLRAAWGVLRALWTLLVWLMADVGRLGRLRDAARGLERATRDAAQACRPDGAARKPVDSLGTAIAGLSIPVPRATPDGEITLLDIDGRKFSIKRWNIEDSQVTPDTSAVSLAVVAAQTSLTGAADRLDTLAEGLGLVAEALDAAVAVLPPEA